MTDDISRAENRKEKLTQICNVLVALGVWVSVILRRVLCRYLVRILSHVFVQKGLGADLGDILHKYISAASSHPTA